jgi:hypothetical protein
MLFPLSGWKRLFYYYTYKIFNKSKVDIKNSLSFLFKIKKWQQLMVFWISRTGPVLGIVRLVLAPDGHSLGSVVWDRPLLGVGWGLIKVEPIEVGVSNRSPSQAQTFDTHSTYIRAIKKDIWESPLPWPRTRPTKAPLLDFDRPNTRRYLLAFLTLTTTTLCSGKVSARHNLTFWNWSSG